MKDLLFFNKMYTPKMITIVYWFLLALVLISGLLYPIVDNTWGLLKGVLTIVFGALGVRIYGELLILLFKIHEELQEIRKKP